MCALPLEAHGFYAEVVIGVNGELDRRAEELDELCLLSLDVSTWCHVIAWLDGENSWAFTLELVLVDPLKWKAKGVRTNGEWACDELFPRGGDGECEVCREVGFIFSFDFFSFTG